MDNFSLGKMNLTRIGNSAQEPRCVPRQSTGISRHAAPTALPSKGPVAIRESTLVSQASPSGSAKFDFSGKSGAREREPQRRGLKIGSIRLGSGFINQAAASTRLKKRSRRRKPSSMRSMEVAYERRK